MPHLVTRRKKPVKRKARKTRTKRKPAKRKTVVKRRSRRVTRTDLTTAGVRTLVGLALFRAIQTQIRRK